jgi:hypothetical protein
VGSTEKPVRRRRAFEDHGDDLQNRCSSAVVAARRLELDGHGWSCTHTPLSDARVPAPAMRGRAVTADPATDWTTPLYGQRIPRCPFVKITQLLGEVHCYLLPGHDGVHCSAEWMEWS